MLDAGIDVFSTVNVQHLESLNDRVAELTGVRVRETFPDSVLTAADEVVLVDLTPEALIAAAARGQGLPGRARPGRAEQLLPRREPRRAARGRAAAGRRGGRGEALWRWSEALGTREELLARRGARRPSPSACWRWSRRGRAPSGSSGAPGARPSAWAPSSTCSTSRGRASRPAARSASSSSAARLASVLGAHLLVEEGDDVVEAAARVAAERGTTYVLIGQPQPRAGRAAR